MGFRFLVFMLALTWCSACKTSSSGSAGSSQPINASEALQQQQALNRCYKTGGSRVIKIYGRLRCY